SDPRRLTPPPPYASFVAAICAKSRSYPRRAPTRRLAMTLEVISPVAELSDALGELAREVARSVVLVRGSMGSAGSGVIWDEPGIVITNHHVVPGGTAELTISDGRRVTARVIRRAPALDLAALRVEHDLTAAASRVGDSDRLR